MKRKADEGANAEANMKKGVVLEVFCGCARLTKTLAARGLTATGIDWKGSVHKALGKTVEIDLTTYYGEAKLMNLLKNDGLVFVHFAPPCGTFSRARENLCQSG